MRPNHIPLGRLCPKCHRRLARTEFDLAPGGTVYSYCRECRAQLPARLPTPTDDPNPSGLCMCGCGRPTAIVDRGRYADGYAPGHHRRYLGGHRRAEFAEYTVNAVSGCWIWRGRNIAGRLPSHYAQRHGEDGSVVQAHRAIYERFRGPIPAGLELDHLCENPRCVNPDHLEPVTHAENIQRGYDRARGIAA